MLALIYSFFKKELQIMRTIHKLIFSLFLTTITCFHFLNSMDPILDKMEPTFNISELRDRILFDLIPYSFNATDNPTKIRNHLRNISLINKNLYQYFNSPKVTHIIMNNISHGRNQNVLAKKIATPGMVNYLKRNNTLHKYINFMQTNRIHRLLRLGADPNYYPKQISKQPLEIPLLFRSLNQYRKTKILLNAGANVNISFKGKTVLQQSIEQNKVNKVKLLLKYNPQNLCLPTAINYQNRKIINAILRQKNIPLQQLNYALGMAIQQSDIQTINKLIAVGADIGQYLDDIKNKFIELANNSLITL